MVAKGRKPVKSKAPGLRVSIVVTAYNEERNIRQCVDALLNQKTTCGTITELIVVASGCTDRTIEIANDIGAVDKRVRVIVQHARLGKASAINAYLRERDPTADVVVLSSADVVVQPGFVDLMLAELSAFPVVGMCGGRVVPTNPPDHMMGLVVRYLWDMHHEIALRAPKMGEAVAIRSALLEPIPEVSAVDEASIEAMVRRAGFQLRYVPGAVVVNHGPDNVREYLRQRRRIASGHYWLRAHSGYEVSTMAVSPLLAVALSKLKLTDTRSDFAAALGISMEVVARTVGYLDYLRGYSHAIWAVSDSTRNVDLTNIEPSDKV